MKWLVTAFEPFGKMAQNSSLLVIERLKAMEWSGKVDFFAPVPVRFNEAFKSFEARLDAYDGVLALGQAEGRSRVSLERLALNFMDARIPDNSGHQPSETRVNLEGPELRWTEIAWPKLLAADPLLEVSYSAGTYVCNTLYYELLGWAQAQGKLAGFVHVPLLESQQMARQPFVRDEDAVAALAKVLNFLLRKPPLKVVAGMILNGRGEVLLAERPSGKHLAGLWEFPGGKVERGETFDQALKRELKEELHLDIRIEKFLGTFPYTYPNLELDLGVFVGQAMSEPRVTRDVERFRWAKPDQIDLDHLAPADRAPLAKFLTDSRPGQLN